MSASVNDKITDIRNAARPNSARATGTRSAGGTSLACDNLSGWPTASKVHFVTYQLNSSSAQVAGTQLDCSGIVTGNTIGSITVIDGTDTGNSVNDVVEMIPTAAWGQDLADALTNQHSRTGTHTVITATSITTTGNSAIGGNQTVAGTSIFTGAVTLPSNTVTNAQLSTTGGEIGGAYASWTPTFVNLTVGNGTLTGKYRVVGKQITGTLDLVWGSTTSISSFVTFSLPVTSVSTYNASHSVLGSSYFDKPGSESYSGVTLWVSTTTATAFVSNGPTDTRLVQLTASKPIGTPGTGTIFSFQFSYEAA